MLRLTLRHLQVFAWASGLPDQIPVSSIDVPQAVVDKWVPRRTYINLLELLAVPLLAFSAPDILRGRDILWFLDNQAAWRAIIRSESSDVSHLVPACWIAICEASLQSLF
jgi:hypothetical protein